MSIYNQMIDTMRYIKANDSKTRETNVKVRQEMHEYLCKHLPINQGIMHKIEK